MLLQLLLLSYLAMFRIWTYGRTLHFNDVFTFRWFGNFDDLILGTAFEVDSCGAFGSVPAPETVVEEEGCVVIFEGGEFTDINGLL